MLEGDIPSLVRQHVFKGMLFERRPLPIPRFPLQEKLHELFVGGFREETSAYGCEHLGAPVIVRDSDLKGMDMGLETWSSPEGAGSRLGSGNLLLSVAVVGQLVQEHSRTPRALHEEGAAELVLRRDLESGTLCQGSSICR